MPRRGELPEVMDSRMNMQTDRLRQVTEPAKPIRLEPRWPLLLACLAVLLVLTLLPARASLLPFWGPYAVMLALMLPMAGVWLSDGHPSWLRLERTTTLVFSAFAEAVTITTLSYLVFEMLRQPEKISGHQLLNSSVTAWLTNVLAFSIWYWRLDRDGPEARANEVRAKGDWLFPQTGIPDEAPNAWRPTFVDYLFLAFSTATAFSTTDVLPLTTRAKMLMMLESSVSLVTLVIVASRAINILSN